MAQAQARFGKPFLVDGVSISQEEAFISQKPTLVLPEDAKKSILDEFGLAPPTRDQLFRVESETSLKERLRRELPRVKNVEFPGEAARLPEVSDAGPFPEQFISPVASQVCYRPLYFENKRTERFGQYVPCVQPFLSAGLFYRDVVILPFRLLVTPPWTFVCDNR